jgi:hypothetical protein
MPRALGSILSTGKISYKTLFRWICQKDKENTGPESYISGPLRKDYNDVKLNIHS